MSRLPILVLLAASPFLFVTTLATYSFQIGFIIGGDLVVSFS